MAEQDFSSDFDRVVRLAIADPDPKQQVVTLLTALEQWVRDGKIHADPTVRNILNLPPEVVRKT